MANRPVFLPTPGEGLVSESPVEFEWYPGFAVSQKQRSIEDLHSAAREVLGVGTLLEVSTKSPDPTGVALSAFNLSIRSEVYGPIPLEAAFQGSKVFSASGQVPGIYEISSGREIKALMRDYADESIVEFRFESAVFSTEPKSAFYDWLYLRALIEQVGDNPEVVDELSAFDGFTDIEFNPKKSVNCQARSCALFVALQGLLGMSTLGDLASSPAKFVAFLNENAYLSTGAQPRLL